MNLHVWWDEPADGPGNMAADELLADEALARGDCCVRIYGWRATTVSLGGFQRQADAAAAPALARLPLVRRPSGGGAIVHGSDLTYAAAVPRSHPWGGRPQALYDAVHDSLRLALSDFGIGVELWRPAQPAGSTEREDGPFLCFDRRASGDVVIGAAGAAGGRGHKILGSAQRRLAATVLQHGSLLVRRNPDVAEAASHPGLEELAGGGFPAAAVAGLTARWMEALAAGLGMRLIREDERRVDDGAVRQRAARFADPRWTARR